MAIITLSRQGGAGGITVAELVTEKLGYSIVDYSIIQEVAEHANVSSNWVKSVENERGSILNKIIDMMISKNYMERIIGEGKGYLDKKTYVDNLKKVMEKYAQKNNCLIVGRGGQYILKDNPNAYHVLIIAEKTDRINFMVDHHNISYSDAKNVVERHDKRRTSMFREFGKEDFDSSNLYHIVINTSKVNVEKAAEIICKLVS